MYVKFPDAEHKNNNKFQMRAIVNAKFSCKNIQNPQDNPIQGEVFWFNARLLNGHVSQIYVFRLGL